MSIEQHATEQTVTSTRINKLSQNNREVGNPNDSALHEPYKPLQDKTACVTVPDRHEPIIVESGNSKKNNEHSSNYVNLNVVTQNSNDNVISNGYNGYSNIDRAAQDNHLSDAYNTMNMSTTTTGTTTTMMPAAFTEANVVNPFYDVYVNKQEQPMTLFTPATINNVQTDNFCTNQPVQRVLPEPRMIMIESSANAANTVPIINDIGRYKVNARDKKTRCGGCCTIM